MIDSKTYHVQPSQPRLQAGQWYWWLIYLGVGGFLADVGLAFFSGKLERLLDSSSASYSSLEILGYASIFVTIIVYALLLTWLFRINLNRYGLLSPIIIFLIGALFFSVFWIIDLLLKLEIKPRHFYLYLVGSFFAGCIFGITPHVILRNNKIWRAGWFILASSFAMTLGYGTFLLTIYQSKEFEGRIRSNFITAEIYGVYTPQYYLGRFLLWTIYAGITALTMEWLVRRTIQQQPSVSPQPNAVQESQ